MCEQTSNIHVNIIRQQSTKAYKYDYIQVFGNDLHPQFEIDLQRRWWRQSHWMDLQ